MCSKVEVSGQLLWDTLFTGAVSKIAGKLIMEYMSELWAPQQLGYGVSGAAEAAVGPYC